MADEIETPEAQDPNEVVAVTSTETNDMQSQPTADQSIELTQYSDRLNASLSTVQPDENKRAIEAAGKRDNLVEKLLTHIADKRGLTADQLKEVKRALMSQAISNDGRNIASQIQNIVNERFGESNLVDDTLRKVAAELKLSEDQLSQVNRRLMNQTIMSTDPTVIRAQIENIISQEFGELRKDNSGGNWFTKGLNNLIGKK